MSSSTPPRSILKPWLFRTTSFLPPLCLQSDRKSRLGTRPVLNIHPGVEFYGHGHYNIEVCWRDYYNFNKEVAFGRRILGLLFIWCWLTTIYSAALSVNNKGAPLSGVTTARRNFMSLVHGFMDIHLGLRFNWYLSFHLIRPFTVNFFFLIALSRLKELEETTIPLQYSKESLDAWTLSSLVKNTTTLGIRSMRFVRRTMEERYVIFVCCCLRCSRIFIDHTTSLLSSLQISTSSLSDSRAFTESSKTGPAYR